MSFIDFLLKYYVWILGVLVIAIITVIGFLADARAKKKKMGKKEATTNNSQNIDNTNDATNVVPQPVQSQSIMENAGAVQPSPVVEPVAMNDVIAPVGDLNVGTLNLNSQPQVEVPVAPVMPTVEPIVQPVQPQVEVPVAPVMPTAEPVVQPVQPQVEVPVAPVMPTVEPVVQPIQPQVEVPIAPVMPTAESIVQPVQSQTEVITNQVVPNSETSGDSIKQPQSINDFNAANMFVTGNN